MKPIFIVFLTGMFISLSAIGIFRFFLIKNRFFILLSIFLAGFPLLLLLFILVPSNLYYLPESTICPWPWLELLFSIFLYTSGFLGGILQIYNLADRGFSLRILIDIFESNSKRLNIYEIITNYSDGKGIKWMYNKRLDDMLANNLITCDGKSVRITKRGILIAKFFQTMRAFINIPILKFHQKVSEC